MQSLEEMAIECVFYDFFAAGVLYMCAIGCIGCTCKIIFPYACTDGHGDWSTQGCFTEVQAEAVKCTCDHLTNFAYLVVNYYSSQLQNKRDNPFTFTLCRTYHQGQGHHSQVMKSSLLWRLSL